VPERRPGRADDVELVRLAVEAGDEIQNVLRDSGVDRLGGEKQPSPVPCCHAAIVSERSAASEARLIR
jgi:hypothetical protein